MDRNKEDLKKINEGDEYYDEIKELTQNIPKSEFYPVFEEKSWACTCGHENGIDAESCVECSASADKLRLIFSELFLMQKKNENAAKRRVSERLRVEEEAEKWRKIDPEVENIYQSAMDFEETRDNYLEAAQRLESIKGYKDSEALAKEYRELAENAPIYDAVTRKSMRAKRRKKIFSIILVAVLSAFVLYALAYFTLIAPRGMRYCVNNGEVTITSYDTFFGGKHAKIPEKLLGKPVTAIGDKAFAGSSALLSVEIPNTVKSIGASAFENCTGLKTVVIPESVTQLGSSVFSNCKSLKTVEIRGKVDNIGIATFFECERLAEVVFHHSPARVETIAFSGCVRLRDIRFTGSEDKWNTVIEKGNDELDDAVISYNYNK